MEPGEIYPADFPEAGLHPVIVVSREELNRGHYALVVVCTSGTGTIYVFAGLAGTADALLDINGYFQ